MHEKLSTKRGEHLFKNLDIASRRKAQKIPKEKGKMYEGKPIATKCKGYIMSSGLTKNKIRAHGATI